MNIFCPSSINGDLVTKDNSNFNIIKFGLWLLQTIDWSKQFLHLIIWGLFISYWAWKVKTCLLETKNPINQKPGRTYTSQLFPKTTVLGLFNLSSRSSWWEDHSPSESWINIRWKLNIFDMSSHSKHIISQDNCLMDHHEC